MKVNNWIEDRIAYIEMTDPEHLNCLSHAICNSLIEEINRAYESECVSIIIKAKCRNQVWSAGHDIRELPIDGTDPLAYDLPLLSLLRKIQSIPIPVIAYVDGTVWGGACDLCFSCDMIVATTESSFAITPAKIGIPYNSSGLMHFMNQLGLNKAREMFFTGMPIEAVEAHNVGVVNYVASAEELPALVKLRVLDPIRRNSILAISAMKRQFRILAQDSSMVSSETFERINAYRKGVYTSPDYREGITAFLEKRTPRYCGKPNQLDI
ncbi:MAG: methylmalonyl-CoA decarboxylase [Phocaeicola sp.]